MLNLKNQKVDFSRYFGDVQLTPKQILIERCKKEGVPIYADDATEVSKGFYSLFRCVASEAELDKRLIAKKMLRQRTYSNLLNFIWLMASYFLL